MADEEFLHRFADFEMGAALDYIKESGRTGLELRQAIEFLIQHREQLRDDEMQKLEAESDRLLKRLKKIGEAKLVEEIKCFKDMLAVHRKVIEENGKPRRGGL